MADPKAEANVRLASESLGSLVIAEVFRGQHRQGDVQLRQALGYDVNKTPNPTPEMLVPVPRDGIYAMLCIPEDTVETVMDRVVKKLFNSTASLAPGDIIRLQFGQRTVALVMGDLQRTWTVLEDSRK